MNEADEKFFAWLDGELDGDEASAMEERVNASPELSKLAIRHRVLRAGLMEAFDTIADAPVPERLRSAAAEPKAVINLESERRSRSWRPLPQWASIAATLAIGILVGSFIPQHSDAPVAPHGGRLYAAAALDRALTTQLASNPSGDIRIGLTFRDRGGAICRSFTEPDSSGLACRSGGRWILRGLFAVPEGQESDYRMAGGMDPNLMALVESNMADQPFDATQEKAAMGRDWR